MTTDLKQKGRHVQPGDKTVSLIENEDGSVVAETGVDTLGPTDPESSGFVQPDDLVTPLIEEDGGGVYVAEPMYRHELDRFNAERPPINRPLQRTIEQRLSSIEERLANIERSLTDG